MEARKIHVYTENDKKVGFNKKLKEERDSALCFYEL